MVKALRARISPATLSVALAATVVEHSDGPLGRRCGTSASVSPDRSTARRRSSTPPQRAAGTVTVTVTATVTVTDVRRPDWARPLLLSAEFPPPRAVSERQSGPSRSLSPTDARTFLGSRGEAYAE